MIKCVSYSFVLAFLIVNIINAEITFFPLADIPNSIWDSDSLFLGAEIAVIDSTKPVVITWKPNSGNALGELFFVPNKGDTSIFLFHNKINEFKNEKPNVEIGTFPKGTKLYFMYIVTDTSNRYKGKENKKLYSGQNRPGKDIFISERMGIRDFRWALAGAVDTTNCELSFASIIKGDFEQIRFHISNTRLLK